MTEAIETGTSHNAAFYRLILLGSAALWGGSYLFTKTALQVMPVHWLMCVRMFGACLCMIVVFHRQIIPYLTARIIVPGVLVGVTYWGEMTAQTIGLTSIDAGRSAFLTAAYCVVVPFATWLICRQRPTLMQLVAAAICLTGVGFVSLKAGSMSPSLGIGDWLTLLCAALCALNIVLLGIFTKRFHPIAMTFMEFLIAGVLYLATALCSRSVPSIAAWLNPDVVVALLFLVLGASMGAQIMENLSLPHLPGAQASIIMCTECLFAAAFSAMFAGERFTVDSLIGFTLIFAAILLSIPHTDE